MNAQNASRGGKRSLTGVIAKLIFPLRRRLTRYRFATAFKSYPGDGQLKEIGDHCFESQGDDPKLLVTFKTPRRPGGLIRVRLQGQAAVGSAHPILYLGDDSGVAGWHGLPMPPLSRSASQPWVIIDAPKASFNLRLDPVDRPGQLELDALEITTLGAADRLVRWLWSGWRRPLTGCLIARRWPMVWSPGNNLRPGPEGQLICDGVDPFVFLYPLKDMRFGDAEAAVGDHNNRPYPCGWVEIDICAQVTKGRLAPRLFVDTGKGFDSSLEIVFDQLSDRRARVLCYLPAGIRRMRLDPVVGQGELRLEAVTFRVLSALELLCHRGWLAGAPRAAFWRAVCSRQWFFYWRVGGGLTVADNGDWLSQSLDPYFLIQPSDHPGRKKLLSSGPTTGQRAPLPSGWAVVRVNAESAMGDLTPELYIDTGDGFDAHPPIDLGRTALAQTGKLCWLPSGILRMRLDPLDHFGRFSISQVSITEVSHLTAAWQLLTQGSQPAAPRRHDPLSHPLGLETLLDLEHRVTPLPVVRDDDRPATINILLPTLNASIVFGGYIAVFNFIVKLRDWGYATRIILCDSDHVDFEVLNTKLSRFPGVAEAIAASEMAFSGTRGGEIRASGKDIFIAFSVWTGLLAHHASQVINRQKFVFFVQEDERIFYENNSYRAIAEQVYQLPHLAIFNSALLQDYFRAEGLGVYQAGSAKGDAAAVNYRHAITAIDTPKIDDLKRPESHTLFFYARPESHAARNLFEIGILALRQAIDEGVFGPEWRFVATGSLGVSGALPLSKGRVLEIATRVDPATYAQQLVGCDIGLSLMYAPHPSVPPLEMASAGMSVVTTTYGRRDDRAMAALSANIIAVAPTIDAVVDGLRQAEARTADLPARVAGAKVAWPIDWDESFNPAVEMAVRRLLDTA